MKNCKPKWKEYKRCIDCNGEIGDFYAKRCRSCFAKTRKGIKPKNYELLRSFQKNPEFRKKVGRKISLIKKGMKQKPQCGFQEGGKHFNWRGGVTNLNHQIRNSLKYKQWRKRVLYKDNYRCVICGDKKQLEADHIKPFALYPELRFKVNNGITLCSVCHYKKTWNYEKS